MGVVVYQGLHVKHEKESTLTTMHMTYYWGVLHEAVVFEAWKPDTTGQTVGSCLIVMALAMLLEFIKYVRAVYLYDEKLTSSSTGAILTNVKHISSCLVYMLQMFLSYTLMLVCMLYNLWLVCSICIGFGLGRYLFGVLPESHVNARGEVNNAVEEGECC